MPQESDNILIEKSLAGDDRAFSQLIQNYQNLVGSLVARIIKDTEDQEEVCQDVFTKVYFKLDKFEFESKFSTWLYTIAYRSAISFLRKKKLNSEPYEDEQHGIVDSGAIPREMELEVSRQVAAAISQLKLEERTALTLYHFNGCTISEIATITEKPEGTIKNLLFRVRKKLQQQLNSTLLLDISV